MADEKRSEQVGHLVKDDIAKLWQTIGHVSPVHINLAIRAIWIAFVVALLLSDFLRIAAEYGPFAAGEFAQLSGPMKTVSEWICGPIRPWSSLDNCEITKQAPSFAIKIKTLLALAIILTGVLWVWARARTENRSVAK
jgi:hypothetical protein